jgi:hypothetical protein
VLRDKGRSLVIHSKVTLKDVLDPLPTPPAMSRPEAVIYPRPLRFP